MKISVIIPYYQQEQHLERVVDSVVRQLGPDDNLIIVNDEPGSYVPTEIRMFYATTERITVLQNGQNLGVSRSRNNGAKHAIEKFGSNQWLKFLDADDELAPFALPSFHTVKIPDQFVVVSGMQVKVVNGIVEGICGSDWRQLYLRNPALLSPSFIWAPAFQAVGGFDERIHFEEDWDLWLKLTKKFGVNEQPPCTNLNLPTCYYWIDDAERAAKVRDHTVEGMDVREYFRKTYGCDPQA